MKEKQLSTIEEALHDLRHGKMIILIDDQSRENEGDLVLAAEHVTPESINFMICQGRGLVCLPMMENDFERLNIPKMTKHNHSPHQTAFGVSIEAASGVTTGISAYDRAHTIKTAINEKSTMEDIIIPGHVFPLKAKSGGVLVRAGHTEGSVDLARLAGLKPAAVICEIMNDDGSMARLPDLVAFAKKHGIKVVTIKDLVTYRIHHEKLIEEISASTLPLKTQNKFLIKMFRSRVDGSEHVALISEKFDLSQTP